MNNIKFRFWDVVAKKMITWDEIRNSPMSDKRFLGVLFDFIHDVTDNIIPLQYTGYNDSLGQEIYHGDVCKYWMDGMWKRGVIIWHRGGWAIDIISMDSVPPSHRVIFDFQSFIPVPDGNSNIMNNKFDRLGSIYENPELVKGSHHEK